VTPSERAITSPYPTRGDAESRAFLTVTAGWLPTITPDHRIRLDRSCLLCGRCH
jgi:hypothetical protein